MSKKTRVLSIVALVVALLAVLVAWRIISNAHLADRKHRIEPLPVDTAAAVIKPTPIQFSVVGQVQSEHTVAVQPQVSGVLKQVFSRKASTCTRASGCF